MSGSPREEAERLVAVVVGAASVAAAGLSGVATGDPSCCACPLCRAINAVRDPDPAMVERLATGAGDLATGLASALRAFTAAGHGPGTAAGPDTDSTGEPA